MLYRGLVQGCYTKKKCHGVAKYFLHNGCLVEKRYFKVFRMRFLVYIFA